jgi:hypothetical protein
MGNLTELIKSLVESFATSFEAHRQYLFDESPSTKEWLDNSINEFYTILTSIEDYYYEEMPILIMMEKKIKTITEENDIILNENE